MFKQFNVKNDYLLIAGSLFLLIVSYQLAFKKTLNAWQVNKQLTSQLQTADYSLPPVYEERKNRNLDKLLDLYKADTSNFRSNIISTIAGIAEKEHVKLTEVPTQDPFYHTDKFIIQKLDFEGGYFDLLKTLINLQAAKSIGMVRSAEFKKTMSYDSKKSTKTSLLVYLEIIR